MLCHSYTCYTIHEEFKPLMIDVATSRRSYTKMVEVVQHWKRVVPLRKELHHPWMRWAIIMQDVPSWSRMSHFDSLMIHDILMSHICYEILYDAHRFVMLKEYMMLCHNDGCWASSVHDGPPMHHDAPLELMVLHHVHL